MNEENREQLLILCERYLSEKPVHFAGFCWWASDQCGNDALYKWMEHLMCAMPDYAGRGYVSEEEGYNVVRAQFVADLRDYLEALKL
jgi:hypothetical protein